MLRDIWNKNRSSYAVLFKFRFKFEVGFIFDKQNQGRVLVSFEREGYIVSSHSSSCKLADIFITVNPMYSTDNDEFQP